LSPVLRHTDGKAGLTFYILPGWAQVVQPGLKLGCKDRKHISTEKINFIDF
jgi:hypothetical protein